MRQRTSDQGVPHRSIIASGLQKLPLTAPTNQRPKRLSYLSLLVEVRNETTSHVLIPSDILFRASEEDSRKATIQYRWDKVRPSPENGCEVPKSTSLPGFQMLATCKWSTDSITNYFILRTRSSYCLVRSTRRSSISSTICKPNTRI